MTRIDFDFSRYVAERKGGPHAPERGGAAYAYPGDQKVLRALSRVTPVTLATEATVRLWKNVAKSEVLGTAVKVTDKQFAEIHDLVVACADKLQIVPPTVYVAPDVGTLNAHTFGTNEDAYIVLNGVLIDHLSADELKFVIGHECGHIQNNHVVYMTALYYLMYSANLFLRWIVTPAVLALQSWARRAEITCDRAGLIACGDVDLALRAVIKLALGSRKLGDQVDIDEYLKQLTESQQSVGRIAEVMHSHPYLPKRAAALRRFGETHYFLKTRGEGDEAQGRSLDACDAEVARILSIFRRADRKERREGRDGHGSHDADDGGSAPDDGGSAPDDTGSGTTQE